MEIVLALVIIVAICFVPSASYLLYTRKRPEPFLNRK
jgi:hypothetical protein